MRAFLVVATLAASSLVLPAMAQTPAAASPAVYTTADTVIGTLLDDPVAHAIVDKHLPGLFSEGQIGMARSMTLKAIQQFAPDRVTDQALIEIDAEFAKLAAKK